MRLYLLFGMGISSTCFSFYEFENFYNRLSKIYPFVIEFNQIQLDHKQIILQIKNLVQQFIQLNHIEDESNLIAVLNEEQNLALIKKIRRNLETLQIKVKQLCVQCDQLYESLQNSPANYFINYINKILLDIPLLYEPNTKFVLLTSPETLLSNKNKVNDKKDTDPISDFLKCNFSYDPSQFWNLSTLKNYESITSGRKHGPLLLKGNFNECKIEKLHKMYDKLGSNKNDDILFKKKRNFMTFYLKETAEEAGLLNYQCEDRPVSNKPDVTMIRLKKCIEVAGKTIEVVNGKDGVKICKKDEAGENIKSLELREALLNYFDANYIQHKFVSLLARDQNNGFTSLSNDTMAWAATQFNHPMLPEASYKHLQDSKILAVWEVRSENFNPKKFYTEDEKEKMYYFKRPVYSIIVGLAYNEKTKKQFHFVTDLGRDIEVLFSLEPCGYTKPKQVDPSTQNGFEENVVGKRKRDESKDIYPTQKKIKLEEQDDIVQAGLQS